MPKFKAIPLLLLLLNQVIRAQDPAVSLDFFIRQGIENSPLLKDYRNQVSAATLDSLLVKAFYRPSVDANAQVMYAPAFAHFGYDEAITNGGNYAGVVGISQNVFNRREIVNKYSGIGIQKQSVLNSFRLSQNELIRIITNQYLTAYADLSDLTFNKKFLDVLTAEVEILKKLVESGIYKQTDYLSLLIETQTQEIAVNQLTNQYYRDIQMLNQVCGIVSSEKVELSVPMLKLKDTVDLSVSPLFLQYTMDSLKIVNDRMAVDIRYRPKVSWFADAGFMSATPALIYNHFGYSAGINFSLPIYDGKQRVLEYQKLDYSENTRTGYQSSFKKQYYLQLLQFRNEMNTTGETLVKLKKQLKTSEDLIVMAKAQLETGNISITEFINAVKNYNSINRDVNQSQVRILQLTNEINYLMQ